MLRAGLEQLANPDGIEGGFFDGRFPAVARAVLILP